MHFTINGQPCEVAQGTTILEAAKAAGIVIPTLCFLKDCNRVAACRMCVVEVEGLPALQAACSTLVKEGMRIQTDSLTVKQSRRNTLDLLGRHHRMDCEYCARYSDCELHALIRENGLDDRVYARQGIQPQEDKTAPYLIRDYSKCIQCRRCAAACEKQTVRAIGVYRRGQDITVGPCQPLPASGCVACGQCIAACPTGALRERDETDPVWQALADHKKRVVAVIAQDAAARVGELFQDFSPVGEKQKLVTILKEIGFDAVYRLEDLKKNVPLKEKNRVISAECPAVLQYIRKKQPDLIPYVESEQDTLQHCAEAARSQAAQRFGTAEEQVFVVAITPCLSEKLMQKNAGSNIGPDVALTTREIGALITRACVSRFTRQTVWKNTVSSAYDDAGAKKENMLGESMTVTGLSEVKEMLSHWNHDTIPAKRLRLFACPGGCLYGGGQPRHR